MIIYIIEFIIHKYYNKAVEHIRLNFDKKILIDILIKNLHFHIFKIIICFNN